MWVQVINRFAYEDNLGRKGITSPRLLDTARLLRCIYTLYTSPTRFTMLTKRLDELVDEVGKIYCRHFPFFALN
ncbi:hypothetical protein [Spirosoma validum]|uniref:Uncharacterized protein n=1 Tax=Spirosoma validum TaxID=2771355 RepID=A0A927GGR2_9BACT|nr:hypothetical protein [Spirosoma validum]MBD2757149.1 hypothetical protein [Spirosoma validum]